MNNNTPIPAGMKQCRHKLCGRILPLDDFDVDKARKDGRRPWCKSCCRRAKAIEQWRERIGNYQRKLDEAKGELARLEAGGIWRSKETRDIAAVEQALAGASHA